MGTSTHTWCELDHVPSEDQSNTAPGHLFCNTDGNVLYAPLNTEPKCKHCVKTLKSGFIVLVAVSVNSGLVEGFWGGGFSFFPEEDKTHSRLYAV